MVLFRMHCSERSYSDNPMEAFILSTPYKYLLPGPDGSNEMLEDIKNRNTPMNGRISVKTMKD